MGHVTLRVEYLQQDWEGRPRRPGGIGNGRAAQNTAGMGDKGPRDSMLHWGLGPQAGGTDRRPRVCLLGVRTRSRLCANTATLKRHAFWRWQTAILRGGTVCTVCWCLADELHVGGGAAMDTVSMESLREALRPHT